ncbi:hypothetical protein SAY87_019741 [Trapa incisa]|uniref:Uncharacterized protein n=1 Tax=Trapa incisa TaxID=236973 RepID=A0AAN7K8D6_9MYRT|nr:hypothetical protein SAY87_019741 [Trapa incisa]
MVLGYFLHRETLLLTVELEGGCLGHFKTMKKCWKLGDAGLFIQRGKWYHWDMHQSKILPEASLRRRETEYTRRKDPFSMFFCAKRLLMQSNFCHLGTVQLLHSATPPETILTLQEQSQR